MTGPAGRLPTISDEVADKLEAAATALADVCQLWDDDDQAAWDRVYADPEADRAPFAMSMEEVVYALRSFVQAAATAPEPVATTVCEYCHRMFDPDTNPNSRFVNVCVECEFE